VIWVITLVTFVGITLAVMLLFFIFAARPFQETRRNVKQHRMEPRTWAAVEVELSPLDGQAVRERTVTENVSHYGACAVTRNWFEPNHIAVVRFLYEGVSLHARVAYCHPSGGAFTVGLQFSTAIDLWMPPNIWLGYRRR
jgi:hypothetical protein